MSDARRHRRRKIRLTAWGWVLSVAFAVLVVLAIVLETPAVYAGLAVVILLWAWLLTSSFPSMEARGMMRTDVGQTDFGRQAAEEHEHKYGHEL